MDKYFALAKAEALKASKSQHYFFGAVGIRSDGKIVKSRNIPNPEINVDCHAEARLSRKLDIGSTVFVVRVGKKNNNLLPACPCISCQRKLRAKKVKNIYYSLDDNTWARLNLF